MMSVNYNRANLLGFVAFLLLSACSKDIIPGNNDGDGLPMTIQPEVVSTDGAVKSMFGGATKATLINEAAGLRTQGFGLSLYDGTTALKSKVEMEYKSGAWAPKGGTMNWKWPAGRTYSFYAWSPADLPVGTVTSTGVPAFTYSGIADQKDIMLGTYTGTGDNGAAPIKFYHPLASIQFKTGKMTNLKTLNKIELEGVITSGTCTPTMSGSSTTFAWSALGTTTTTLSQTGLSVASTTSGTAIGKSESDSYFLVLPQSAPLTVKITDSDNKVITATIATPALTAGHTAVYTIDYDGLHVTLSVSIKDWGAGQSEAVAIEEKTGPDPEYWVDLGMVSEDGYPLYISRRNVQSISNGVAVFADSETAFGGTFTKEQALSIVESEDGLDCICLSTSQALSMLLGNNFNFALSEGVAEFTSKINGAVVKFPYQSGVLYFTMGKIDYASGDMNALQFDLNCPSSQYLKYYEIDFKIYVYDSAYCKLIYKDTNASKKPYIDFELWHFNTLKEAFWGYPYFPLENNDFETLHKISDSLGPIGLGNVDCGVQYLIEFGNGYRTFCFTNSTFPDGVEIELSDVGGGLQYYELDGKNIKYKKNGGHDPSVQYTATWLGKTISFQFNGRTCLVKGTLVTLADGSRKPVEELTYDDELKVWNFDKGCFDTAKIFWLTKSGMTADHYIKCTFSDGSVLCLTGDKSHHKVYNYTDRFFEGIAKVEVGKEIFTENGVVTLVSKEWIDEPVENYNLMTEGHFNCFANGILTSVRLNNIYPIDENMKFVKDSRKKRPYKEFKAAGISREWYNGLRLSEQTDSLDYIRSKVDIFTEQMFEKPAPTFWQKLKTWWKSIFG